MKKAQYYRSATGRKVTAKAVKNTATTVTKNETTGQSSRSTTAQTDSPFAELFPERLYNLTLPTEEESLSAISDFQREFLKSVYGDEEELSWIFDKTMLKCSLEETILASFGLLHPIEVIRQLAEEGFRLAVAALETVSHMDTKGLLEGYDRPKPSEDFVKGVPDWIMKELSSADLTNEVKEVSVDRILYFCEQQSKNQWTKVTMPLTEIAVASSLMLMMKADDLEGWNDSFRIGAIGGAGQVCFHFRGTPVEEADGAILPEDEVD